jgi:hypothetical protein
LPDGGAHGGKVDLIFHDSEDCLRAGHHYEVRVDDQPRNPRIVEVIRELTRENGPSAVPQD